MKNSTRIIPQTISHPFLTIKLKQFKYLQILNKKSLQSHNTHSKTKKHTQHNNRERNPKSPNTKRKTNLEQELEQRDNLNFKIKQDNEDLSLVFDLKRRNFKSQDSRKVTSLKFSTRQPERGQSNQIKSSTSRALDLNTTGIDQSNTSYIISKHSTQKRKHQTIPHDPTGKNDLKDYLKRKMLCRLMHTKRGPLWTEWHKLDSKRIKLLVNKFVMEKDHAAMKYILKNQRRERLLKKQKEAEVKLKVEEIKQFKATQKRKRDKRLRLIQERNEISVMKYMANADPHRSNWENDRHNRIKKDLLSSKRVTKHRKAQFSWQRKSKILKDKKLNRSTEVEVCQQIYQKSLLEKPKRTLAEHKLKNNKHAGSQLKIQLENDFKKESLIKGESHYSARDKIKIGQRSLFQRLSKINGESIDNLDKFEKTQQSKTFYSCLFI